MSPFPAYAVEQATPGFAEWLQKFSAESRRVQASRRCQLDVAFGDAPAERLDIFPADNANAPIVVFLHGGGWRASSKGDRSFPADVFCPAGAVWISMEYPLAPAASVDDMVACLRKGMAWVAANARSFGGDPDRIFVCGNSAGGHLASVMMTTDWTEHGLPADLIKGGTFVSGVFDMIPLMKSGANEWLRLDIDTAVRHSAIYNVPRRGGSIVCAVGADEMPEFVEQSRNFAAVWRFHGHPATFLPCPELHHFSIIAELGRRDSALVRAMFDQIGSR
ncbi:alpha/beta hydrolase [Ramlibacter henchirensis]|uniref:Alpha/beta hydrolase n=1 Tax=Ramlibacter henchirensis TaxID=204072 RepID=A0A4Z0BUX1_9BURK|nr:alpha/beta hydrolase [Ramlibacter henchirensis]TFZ02631.1 alpha/beta hydrolase [Ramlibacter henchirensis]